MHYFRFCPTAGWLAGWHWWVGGWTNIARLPNGLPWTRARPQCYCIHANLHHFIVVTLLEMEVQSNKPKDLRCGLNPTLYLISYQSHIKINIHISGIWRRLTVWYPKHAKWSPDVAAEPPSSCQEAWSHIARVTTWRMKGRERQLRSNFFNFLITNEAEFGVNCMSSTSPYLRSIINPPWNPKMVLVECAIELEGPLPLRQNLMGASWGPDY